MSEKECAQILSIIRTAYPSVKIENAKGMVQAWLMSLGEFSANSVMKAARLHMETSKYFPTPAEIREKIVRAELIYNGSDLDINRIDAPSVKQLEDPENKSQAVSDEYLENFCKFIGLGYPNEIEDD